MLVAVQLSVTGLYLPPVLKWKLRRHPPQTIISLPVQTAVYISRAAGTLVVLVAVQLFELGLYLPPVFKFVAVRSSAPNNHFTAGPYGRGLSRAVGAFVVLVAVQLSVVGLYLPPVFKVFRHIHPRQSFHCLSILPCGSGSGSVGGASGCPTIRAGIVSAAGVEIMAKCAS